MSESAESTPKKIPTSHRSRARHYAMQAIYQWQMTGDSLNAIEAQFHTDNDMKKVDLELFHDAFFGVAENSDRENTPLDELFEPYLSSKSKKELDPVTLSLLRMSTWELKERIETPYRVVINEALNLAKKFGAEDSHKFINGVLDKLAGDLRKLETASR